MTFINDFEGGDPYKQYWTGGPMDHFEIESDSLDNKIIDKLTDDVMHVYPENGNFLGVTKLQRDAMDDGDSRYFLIEQVENFDGFFRMKYCFYKTQTDYNERKEQEDLSNAQKELPKGIVNWDDLGKHLR